MNTSDLITAKDALNCSRAESKELYRKYINPGFVRLLGLLKIERKFVRAEGFSIQDDKGNLYIDFLGGYGSLNWGHNHPEILNALKDFLTTNHPNILQVSVNSIAASLAHNLALITPGNLEKSFFCNSGAEAVEGALKIARKATGRENIIYAAGSFHGKTLGALSVTGREKYQKPFKPLLPGCYPVPYGQIEPLKQMLAKKAAAAFIVEPVQGEGGIVVPPDGYLKKVQELCKKYGTLLIVDEIQTGLGRTGKKFACEYDNVTPDIMTLAKSLGGGVMPLGAYITTSEVWSKAYGDISGMESLLHTSTFGGNSLACLAGLKSVEILIKQRLSEKTAENGRYFLEELNKIQAKYPKKIREVRGRGLMIGIEFYESKLPGVKRLEHEYQAAVAVGVLLNKYKIITAYTLNNPNVIRIEPPLNITTKEIDRFLYALDKFCSDGGFFRNIISLLKSR